MPESWMLPLSDMLDILKAVAPSGVAGVAVKLVLNGTKERTVRIEQKLDGHITQTSANLRDTGEKLGEISERVSTIEGRLAPRRS